MSEEIDENAASYHVTEEEDVWTGAVVIYSLGFDAEQLLALYGALAVYLKTLSQQESQDFETIRRVAGMLIEIKPRAIEASKSLALKAAGM